MTATEKANILHTLMYGKFENGVTWEEAKRCALIAVDEIIKSMPKQPSINITMPHFEATVYWEEVKGELLKQ